MLTIYLFCDMFQVFLFLTEASLTSGAFWIMIIIGEVSSVFKNSGGMEVLAWRFGFRETFPYTDIETIKKLKAKALVDSMSEILAGVGAFTVLASEKAAREQDIGAVYNVTAVNATDGGTIVNYQSTKCMATCISWSVDDLVPPPQELPSRAELLFLFAVITGDRLLFLYLEFTVLNMIQARFEAVVTPVVTPAVVTQAVVTPVVVGDEEGLTEEGNMRERATQQLTQQARDVAGAAASVLASVPLSFLGVAFFLAVQSVVFGLLIMAWIPLNPEITVELMV